MKEKEVVKKGWNSNINMSTKVYKHFLLKLSFHIFKKENLTKNPKVSKNQECIKGHLKFEEKKF